jgi:DNA-binding MarR family transcriptional regulator
MRERDEFTNEDDSRIALGEVAAYLGVGRRVVSRLVKGGVIKIHKDPLDDRRKLVSVRQLEQLKRQSR